MVDKSDPDLTSLRNALVDQLLSNKFIQSPPVEAAFRAVPRHLFLPGVPLAEVYSDRAIVNKQDESGRWISSSSQPAIMAIMLEQLGLQPGHKVLEIGAGTGYNAAIMAHLVGETGQVVTVDIDADLAEGASQRLDQAGYTQVQVVCADGGYGYPPAGPYDRLILTVGAADIAPAWWEQLLPGGRLVLPLEIASGEWQKSVAFDLVDGLLISRSLRDCGFMTLRGAFSAGSIQELQLGPQEGLLLLADAPLPADLDQVYAWLQAPARDRDTGVTITLRDFMRGLRLWLQLHEPALATLRAVGDLATHPIVPPLIGFGGEWQSLSTHVLIGAAGLAALMRPPGQPAPLADVNDLFASDQPFNLFIRQFGSSEPLSLRLVNLVQAWQAAGRPSTDSLRIKAIPPGSSYFPAPSEILVDKQWSRLALTWSTT